MPIIFAQLLDSHKRSRHSCLNTRPTFVANQHLAHRAIVVAVPFRRTPLRLSIDPGMVVHRHQHAFPEGHPTLATYNGPNLRVRSRSL